MREWGKKKEQLFIKIKKLGGKKSHKYSNKYNSISRGVKTQTMLITIN